MFMVMSFAYPLLNETKIKHIGDRMYESLLFFTKYEEHQTDIRGTSWSDMRKEQRTRDIVTIAKPPCVSQKPSTTHPTISLLSCRAFGYQ